MTSIGMAWRMGRATRVEKRRGPSAIERAVTVVARKLPTLKRARTALMQTAGIGAIDYGVFAEWGLTPGLICVGVSLFVLEYLGGDR